MRANNTNNCIKQQGGGIDALNNSEELGLYMSLIGM